MRSMSVEQKLPAYKRDPRKILCQRACLNCGVTFPVAKKFPAARFCSRKCGLASTLPADHNAKIARESARRRGDALRGTGRGATYRKLGGRHEHRVVAEAAIGRPLRPGEVVHHRDGDIRNNAPSNLDVLPSQGAHARLHDSLHTNRIDKVGSLIEHGGKKQNITAWAEEAGLLVSTLSYRLRRGWPFEAALSTPTNYGNRVMAL